MESLSEFEQYIHCDKFRLATNAKFGIFNVVGLNGTLAEAKNMHLVHLNVFILALTSVPFRPTRCKCLI
jgi:hypothetical protein